MEWTVFLICLMLGDLIIASLYTVNIKDEQNEVLNCTEKHRIQVSSAEFNSSLCNTSDDSILHDISSLCNRKEACRINLTAIISCSSNYTSDAALKIEYYCARDGGWTEWSLYGDCSVTCGNGVQFRSRSCSNPIPSPNGHNCSGNEEETINCTKGSCSNPFLQNYNEGDFAVLTCSEEYNETIGIAGINYSHGSCIHSDSFGVRNLCSGLTTCRFDVTNSNIGSSCGRGGTASLNITYNCIRNGGWTDWTDGTCSKTCGGGVQNVTRNCTNPTPNEFGHTCTGKAHDVHTCNDNDCVHDEVSCINSSLTWICQGGYIDVLSAQWKTHADCIGFQTYKAISVINRLKTLCSNKTMCTFIVGDTAFGESCSKQPSTCSRLDYVYSCKKAKWSEWSEWSNCSKSCGNGIQTRTRYCTNPTITKDGYRIDCKGSSSDERLCNTKPCTFCGSQDFLQFDMDSSNVHADSTIGTGYILFDEEAQVGCCGRIRIFEFIPVNIGTLTFVVWRKVHNHKYEAIGTNQVVISASQLNKKTRHEISENKQIAVQNGDLLGWHHNGKSIIGYIDCYPTNETCVSSILRTTGSTPKQGDEIDTEHINKVSNRIYSISYSTTTNRAPHITHADGEIMIPDHTAVDSKVTDIEMSDPDFADYIRNIQFDLNNTYFYFDTMLRSVHVKSTLPHIMGRRNSSHVFTLRIEDSCLNEVTTNLRLISYNSPPEVEHMKETVIIDSTDMQNRSILSSFNVTDLSGDNVSCIIARTVPQTEIFSLDTEGYEFSLKLVKDAKISSNSSIIFEVNFVCDDGTDSIDIQRIIEFLPGGQRSPDPGETDNDILIILLPVTGLFLLIIIIIATYFICKSRQKFLVEKLSQDRIQHPLSTIDGCALTSEVIGIDNNGQNIGNAGGNDYIQMTSPGKIVNQDQNLNSSKQNSENNKEQSRFVHLEATEVNGYSSAWR